MLMTIFPMLASCVPVNCIILSRQAKPTTPPHSELNICLFYLTSYQRAAEGHVALGISCDLALVSVVFRVGLLSIQGPSSL